MDPTVAAAAQAAASQGTSVLFNQGVLGVVLVAVAFAAVWFFRLLYAELKGKEATIRELVTAINNNTQALGALTEAHDHMAKLADTDGLTGIANRRRFDEVLDAEFARLRIGAQRYAIFTHIGHVSTVRGTFMAIFNDWFPTSGHHPADAAVFERYDERFDARTGVGGFEIWVPIEV